MYDTFRKYAYILKLAYNAYDQNTKYWFLEEEAKRDLKERVNLCT